MSTGGAGGTWWKWEVTQLVQQPPPVMYSPIGLQANQQSQVFRPLWKDRRLGEKNLTLGGGRMFQRTGATAKKALLLDLISQNSLTNGILNRPPWMAQCYLSTDILQHANLRLEVPSEFRHILDKFGCFFIFVSIFNVFTDKVVLPLLLSSNNSVNL